MQSLDTLSQKTVFCDYLSIKKMVYSRQRFEIWILHSAALPRKILTTILESCEKQWYEIEKQLNKKFHSLP